MQELHHVPHSSDDMLDLIFSYIERISEERSLDKVLLLLADFGKELIDADRCTVWMWDKKNHELYTRAAHGVDKLSLPEGTGLVGYAIENGEDVIINDPYSDPRFNQETDRMTGYVTREILVLPIRGEDGTILGAYQALNKTTGDQVFSEKDLKHLRLATSYSGKSIENALLNEDIDKAQHEMIHVLGQAGERRSLETGNHVTRVAIYSSMLARQMKLSPREIDTIKMASPMHDIGKIGIPDAILQKPGRFTDEEYAVMKTHSEIGYEILNESESALMRAAAHIAREHHERYDGRGYPNGLKGEEIDLLARIVAVSDVFDALVSDRCYKKAWDLERVVALFHEERGFQFDPKVVDALFEAWDQLLMIKEQYEDAPGTEV